MEKRTGGNICTACSALSVFSGNVFQDGIKQIFFIPLMLCVFGLMLLYIKMAGELSWRETGFFCAKAFISAEFAASLCWQIFIFIQAISLLLKWKYEAADLELCSHGIDLCGNLRNHLFY